MAGEIFSGENFIPVSNAKVSVGNYPSRQNRSAENVHVDEVSGGKKFTTDRIVRPNKCPRR